LWQCSASTHLCGHAFDTLENGAVLVEQKDVTPLIHDFHDELHHGQGGRFIDL